MSTINEDFNKVKKTIETTTSPTQFKALKKMVECFGRKWNAIEPVVDESYGFNQDKQHAYYQMRKESKEMYDYLRLKVDFEKQ